MDEEPGRGTERAGPPLRKALADHFRDWRRGRDREEDGPAGASDEGIVEWVVSSALGESAVPPSGASTGEVDSARDAGARSPEEAVCRYLTEGPPESGPDATAGMLRGIRLGEVWPPLRLRLLETVAVRGERRALLELLSPETSPSLDLLEFRLEVPWRNELGDEWFDAVAMAAFPLLDDGVVLAWRRLLAVEARAACGRSDPSVQSELTELAQLPPEGAWDTLSGRLAKRIASRAAAALVRLRLETGSEWWDVLEWPSFLDLPEWERRYLRALVEWRSGNPGDAAAMLASSGRPPEGNEFVRTAEAALIATEDPERSLTLLDPDHNTFERRVARLSLLCRLRRHDEAEALAAPPPAESDWEPLRFSWAAARADLAHQFRGIRSALAEAKKDWSRAYQEAAAIRNPHAVRSSPEGRLAFLARKERDSIPVSDRWRREQSSRRFDRHTKSVSRTIPSGDELWYRAMARLEDAPGAAAEDLKKLLTQSGWTRVQRLCGGGRLVMAGDLLLLSGHAERALEAYESSGAPEAEVIPRTQFAIRLSALERGASPRPSEAGRLSGEAAGGAGAFLKLLDALGHASANRPSDASDALEAAAKEGCGNSLCFGISLALGLAAPSAESFPEGSESEPWLADLFQLCDPGRRWPERIAEFVERSGGRWMERCPFDPEAAARTYLVGVCEDRDWPRAKNWLAGIPADEHTWSAELAGFVALREAIHQAMKREVTEAWAAVEGVLRGFAESSGSRVAGQ